MLGRKFPLAAGLPIEPNTLSWLPAGFTDQGLLFSDWSVPDITTSGTTAVNGWPKVSSIEDQVFVKSMAFADANTELGFVASPNQRIVGDDSSTNYTLRVALDNSYTISELCILCFSNFAASTFSLAVEHWDGSAYNRLIEISSTGGTQGSIVRDNSGNTLSQKNPGNTCLAAVNFSSDTHATLTWGGSWSETSFGTAYGSTVNPTHISFRARRRSDDGLLVLQKYPTESEAKQIAHAFEAEIGGGDYTGPAS